MTKCTVKDHLDLGPLETERLSDENHVSATFLPRRFERLLEHAINYQRCWCLLYFCCISMKANHSTAWESQSFTHTDVAVMCKGVLNVLWKEWMLLLYTIFFFFFQLKCNCLDFMRTWTNLGKNSWGGQTPGTNNSTRFNQREVS